MKRLRLPGDSTAALGAFVLIAAAVMTGLAFSGHLRTLFGEPSAHTVTAEFANAKTVRKGDDVRIDGIDAGKVEDVRLGEDGRTTTITMKVQDSAGPLYRDARAEVRWKTLLGGAFYIALERGSERSGPLAGRPIASSRTSSQVELDDVLTTFRGRAEKGLQRMPGELATALEDPDAPARALETLDDVAPGARDALDGLHGEQEDEDLRVLVRESSAAVSALDRPTGEMQDLVEGAAATFEITSARAGDLRSTFAQAPGVMNRSRATLGRLNATLARADGLVSRLRGPAVQVAPTLARVRPTLVEADQLLGDARPLLNALPPTAAALRRTATEGLPLLRELQPSIDRVDGKILPFLAKRDPETERRAYEMIGPTFAGLATGAAGQEDGNGHFIRFPATVGSSPAQLPCQIYVGNPSKDKLAECKSIEQALNDYLSYSPLAPMPGTEGNPKP